jgi:hypothetical protein
MQFNFNTMFMYIKINLEKVYYHLYRNFVENCATNCKSPPKFINIIHHCITYPSVKILWNNNKTEEFSPTINIRQGDHLYEASLSHIIIDQVEDNYLKPMRASISRPQLSHLLFAIDILLFT